MLCYLLLHKGSHVGSVPFIKQVHALGQWEIHTVSSELITCFSISSVRSFPCVPDISNMITLVLSNFWSYTISAVSLSANRYPIDRLLQVSNKSISLDPVTLGTNKKTQLPLLISNAKSGFSRTFGKTGPSVFVCRVRGWPGVALASAHLPAFFQALMAAHWHH